MKIHENNALIIEAIVMKKRLEKALKIDKKKRKNMMLNKHVGRKII